MTAPLTAEEREEMRNLAAEMELDTTARSTYATELLRMRSFVSACRRHRLRLPAKLQALLALKCPERQTYDDWRQIAAHNARPEIDL